MNQKPPVAPASCCNRPAVLSQMADYQDGAAIVLATFTPTGRDWTQDERDFHVILSGLISAAEEWDVEGGAAEILDALAALLDGTYNPDVVHYVAARLQNDARYKRCEAATHSCADRN